MTKEEFPQLQKQLVMCAAEANKASVAPNQTFKGIDNNSSAQSKKRVAKKGVEMEPVEVQKRYLLYVISLWNNHQKMKTHMSPYIPGGSFIRK